MSITDLAINLDNDLLMYALIGLMGLWLFFRIFKRTEKPRLAAQVSRKAAGWSDASYTR